MVLVVAGSSPVGHPWDFKFSIADCRFPFLQNANLKSKIEHSAVPVAQPDRASDFGLPQKVLHSFAKCVFQREIR